MDRRDTIKSLLAGALAGGVLLGTNGCKQSSKVEDTKSEIPGYGRQPEEKLHDSALFAEQFYSDHEMMTIAVLCDIILPSTASFKSASALGVPEFIEFMTKDFKGHQLPMRGGLMWLDNFSNAKFGKKFSGCTKSEQLELVDSIAYPSEDKNLSYGIQFFNRIRNLTLTGYYTTREGIEELGYQGNRANVWDGVPAEVLARHDVEYDEVWLAKCVDQSKRMDIAEWDEDQNLIT